MAENITVNGAKHDWHDDMNLFEVFRIVGYKLKVPVVLVQVNGETVMKARWKDYVVPKSAEIFIRNIFNGG